MSLGVGWPLCLVFGYWSAAPGVLASFVAATWLINSGMGMMAVRNRSWIDAGLIAAVSGILWFAFESISRNAWSLAGSALYDSRYQWAVTRLFSEQEAFAANLVAPVLTAVASGSILTFVLYRRAKPPSPPLQP